MKKISGDTILSILIAALSVIMLYFTKTTISPNSPGGDPGAQLFPAAICVVLLIFSIILFVQSLRHPNHAFQGLFQNAAKRKSLIQAGLGFLALCLFLILWQLIPFVIACFIFVLLLCLILQQKPLFSFCYSLGVSLVLYIVFVQLLNVRLDIY